MHCLVLFVEWNFPPKLARKQHVVAAPHKHHIQLFFLVICFFSTGDPHQIEPLFPASRPCCWLFSRNRVDPHGWGHSWHGRPCLCCDTFRDCGWEIWGGKLAARVITSPEAPTCQWNQCGETDHCFHYSTSSNSSNDAKWFCKYWMKVRKTVSLLRLRFWSCLCCRV